MIRFPALAAVALAAATVSAPALADTYNLFDSFNGTSNPVNNFTFGVFDGRTFSAYTSSGDCPIGGVTCLNNGPANNGLPGVFKTTGGASTQGTVKVPADALVFHPGPNAGQASGFEFTAPTSQYYRIDATAFVTDQSPNPNGVTIGALIDRGRGLFSQPLGTLSASNPSFTGTYTTYLVAGQSIGGYVDFNVNYFNDSTGARATVTGLGQTIPTPEPAAFALFGLGAMALGFARRKG